MQEEQQYINLLTMMSGKTPSKKIAGKIEIEHKPEKLNRKITFKKVNLKTLRTIRMAALQYRQNVLTYLSSASSQKPDLNFILNAGRVGTGNDIGKAFDSFDKNQIYAGLEFNMYLQNTDKKNETRASKAARNKAAQDYRDVKKKTSFALINLRNAIFRMRQLLKISIRMAAANNFRQGTMYRKYTQGRVPLSQVTDARDGYANARVSYLEQQASLFKLYLDYLAITDTLLKQMPISLSRLKK